MVAIRKKVVAAALLVLPLLVVACEGVRSTAPFDPTQPAISAPPTSPSQVSGTLCTFGGAVGDLLGCTVRLVTSDGSASGTQSVMIGSEGGTLSVDGHRLVVPPLAVSSRMCFTMASVRTGFVEVDLKAVTLANEADCGKSDAEGTYFSGNFAVPVQLTMSFASGTNLPSLEASKLAVWYRASETTFEKQPAPAAVDLVGKTVSASLSHFSKYVVGCD